jgi:NAD(P)H-dependent FMN reductase
MTKPRIGIVISTTREGRFADTPANWLLEIAGQRDDATFEIVDLRDYPLPFFEEQMSPAFVPPANPVAQAWAAKMAELDGYVFVTAEYNHSISGVLKNALDYAYNEYRRKPASFVGYGGVGGARAVEQLRLILAELQIASLKHTVHISANEFMGVLTKGKSLSDYDYLEASAVMMLDNLVWWAEVLLEGRQARPAAIPDFATMAKTLVPSTEAA